MTNVFRAGAALVLAALVCVGPPGAVGAVGAVGAAGAQSVDLGGAPIMSSTDPMTPTLLSAGVWADVLGAATSPAGRHEFAYQRTMADSTVHLGVVGAPTDPGGSDALRITAGAPGGIDCGTDDSTTSFPVVQRLLGVGLSVGADELGDRNADCLRADEITFTVDRSLSDSGTELPIAIRVVEEAPVEDTAADLPTASESPRVDVPDPAAAPTEVGGEPSFDRAPLLEPGMTYADAVPQGGTLLYRVHLDWGQALAVRVDVPAQDATASAALVSAEPDVEISLLDPLRDVWTGEVEQSVDTGEYAADEATRLVEGTAPLRYLNRFADVAGTVPGDYWVAVTVEPAAPDTEADAAAVEVPFTLVADVTGSPDGAPTHPETVQSPGGDAGPVGYAAATPYLLADGVFAADVARDAAGVGGTVPEAPSRDHARLAGGILLGAISLGCCAAGVTLLRRRPAPE